MSTVVYGIANCDTIRKARRWLSDQGIEYQFHDVRKQGLEQDKLQSWNSALGWDTLLNRRGMMWRKLSDEQKQNIDEASALAIMLEEPAIIKRPVLEHNGELHIGFKEDSYREIFGL